MRKRIFRISLLTAFVVAVQASLFAEEGSVILRTIKTDIDGKTHRSALLRELRVEEEMVFPSEEEMRHILAVRIANLDARGVFKEFETEIIEASPNEFELDLRIVDKFTFYPAPILAYSSSLGPILGGTFAYGNAFGSMTDQMVMGYWTPAKTYLMADVANIAAGPLTLEVKFEQEIGLNQFGNTSGDAVLEYDSMSSLVSVLAMIPLGLDGSWSYWIEPIASFQYGYDLDHNTSLSLEGHEFYSRGFVPGFNHGFVFDNVTKEENLRRGIRFTLENDNLWYTGSGRNDLFLESDLIGLIPAAKWLEFSGRIGGFYAVSGIRRDAGDRLRGTLDYMTYGTAGAYFTGQVNFRTLRTSGGFEIHVRPFTDIGYVKSDEWNDGFDSFEYNVGSSFIFYFPALSPMSINFDLGWDIKRHELEVIVGFEPFI